jgi:MFS family permease
VLGREPELGPELGLGREAELGLRAFLTSRRWLVTLAGTAGCWFLLDYAYYGNTISTPQILGLISPHASTMTKIALQLAIFAVAAVPGYALAIARLDRIGHRRLQLAGFAVAAAGFALTLVLPEPAGRSLEDIAVGASGTDTRPMRVAARSSAS